MDLTLVQSKQQDIVCSDYLVEQHGEVGCGLLVTNLVSFHFYQVYLLLFFPF